MSTIKFSRRKALAFLRLKEHGTSVTEICKKKISRATFCNWMTILRIESLEKENRTLKKELLRLKPKNKTRVIPSEFNPVDGSNNEEFFEMMATFIADIILSDNNNNLKEFLNRPKS